MSSEFINDGTDVDEITASCKDVSSRTSTITYILIVVAVILFLIVLFNMYGGDITGYFQGAFPERSDIGADKFDLQKEVKYLAEKQLNNLGQ